MNHDQPDHSPDLQSPIEAELVAPPMADSSRHDARSAAKAAVSSVTESRAMVLAILFGVTGALGIPLLWVNKRFSVAERIFWSIAVLIYTTALVGITAAIVMWSYRMIMERLI